MKDNDKIMEAYVKVLTEETNNADDGKLNGAAVNLRWISEPCCGNCKWIDRLTVNAMGLEYNCHCTNSKLRHGTQWSIGESMICDLFEKKED